MKAVVEGLVLGDDFFGGEFLVGGMLGGLAEGVSEGFVVDEFGGGLGEGGGVGNGGVYGAGALPTARLRW